MSLEMGFPHLCDYSLVYVDMVGAASSYQCTLERPTLVRFVLCIAWADCCSCSDGHQLSKFLTGRGSAAQSVFHGTTH